MRHHLFCIAIALSVLVVNSVAATEASAIRDMSAAKKKKPRAVKPSERAPTVAAQRGWFDPSLGPDGKPYRNPYPPGTCSIDQGYGRFTTCDFHD